MCIRDRGDWKVAAMTRIMKLMAEGMNGGTAFMEDYTYHFEPGNEMLLGSHLSLIHIYMQFRVQACHRFCIKVHQL